MTESVKSPNPETALAVQQPGGAITEPMAVNWAEDAGEGSTVGRDFDRRLLLIPSIIVLQSDTPFCKKTSPEFIPGCIDGNFFNLSTHESYEGQKQGIQIVPSFYCSDYEERTPPAKEGDRGELLAILSEKSDVIRASGWRDKKFVTPDGNILHERGNMYCMLLGKDQSEFSPVLFRFRSNNLKVFKQLVTQISNWLQPDKGKKIKPPCFAGIYRMVTIPDHNDKFSWWGLKLVSTDLGNGRVSFQSLVTNPGLYDTAKAFRASIAAGEAVAAEDRSKEEAEVDLDGAPF